MKKRSRLAAAAFILLLPLCLLPPALAAEKGHSLKKAKILLPQTPAVYTGKALRPRVTVTLNGEALTEGEDYTLEYAKNVDAGSGVVRAVGMGSYTGSVKRSFPIYRAENVCQVSDLVLPYSTEAQEAELTVSLSHEEKLSFSSSRREVTVSRRGAVKIAKGFAGIAEITVTAAESKNYKRVREKAYVVCLQTPEITEAVSRSSRSGRISFTECKRCDGYEIRVEDSASAREFRWEPDPELGERQAAVPLGPGSLYALSVRSVYTRGERTFTSPWSGEVILETPEEILLTGSDYITREGELSWTAWRIGSDLFGRLMRAGVEPDRILLCGDYSDRSPGAPGDAEKSIANLREDFGIFYDDTKPDRQEIFVRGDLDRAGAYAEDGPLESAHSIVYVLSADTANPASQGAGGARAEEMVRASAGALRAFLSERAAAGERRLIVIASHVPLHFSSRTAETGDNLYSGLLFDAINEWGGALDIVYLFGHNRGGYGDGSIGGSRICRIPGEALLIPQPAAGQLYRKETLRFVYMNAGYMGVCEKVYGARGASAGVLTLYPDRLVISRGALKKCSEDLSLKGEAFFAGQPADSLSVRRETVTLLRKAGGDQEE